jgi:hypothetical protein
MPWSLHSKPLESRAFADSAQALPASGSPRKPRRLGLKYNYPTLQSSARVMPKRKKKVFKASKAVKAAAREHIGSPPPRRVETPRPQKPPRYKRTIGNLLVEE